MRKSACSLDEILHKQLYDGRAILDRLAAIPITTWSYKSEGESVRHIGPMAQDFQALFGVGTDERHIANVDADGVALAAIQGLNQKLETTLREKEVELERLKARLTTLEQLVFELRTNLQR